MFSVNLTDLPVAFKAHPNDTGLSALTATDKEKKWQHDVRNFQAPLYKFLPTFS